MIIENTPLSIKAQAEQKISLTDLQRQYLQILQQGHTLSQLVEFFLKQGWLVNFQELYQLVEKLVEKDLIGNPTVQHYFAQMKPMEEKSFLASINPFSEKPAESRVSLKDLPFFRSLPPEWTKYLLSLAKTLSVPNNVLITRQGGRDRDLYVLLQGHASVIRGDNGQKKVIAQLQAPAVFGEGSFFLNHPRSADILTREECVILKIPFTPEVEQLVQKDKAEAAQIRIWIQHALSTSPLFKNIPSDVFDALTFAGRPVRLTAKQCLFTEGQPGPTSYILIQGELVVSQKGRMINHLKQGAFLGEISMLASGGIRTATIHAATDCLLMEIQQQDFYRLLGGNIILGKELEMLAAQRLQADRARA